MKVSKSRWEKFVMDASRVGPEEHFVVIVHRCGLVQAELEDQVNDVHDF